MTSSNNEQRDWRHWNLREWNTALFEHAFSSRSGDDTPVTRLVLTDEEFGRVICDDTQPANAVRDAFRSAVLRRLEVSGYTLIGDAKYVRSAWAGEIPAFFAHLVVTCIAATWDKDPAQPDGEFRKRLNRFLGRDGTSYWLNDLPDLWEELRGWLDAAIDSGLPYRPLILRRLTHMRLIGYSVDLAFPSLQDTAELVHLFTQAEVYPPPSVSLVLSTVQGHLHSFGHRFRDAFEEFDRAVTEQDPLRYRSPFWSVALEAARLAKHQKEKGARKHPRVELALEFDPDGSSRVVPFLDSPLGSAPPPPHVVISDPYGTVDGFAFVLETEPPCPPDETAGGLTLAGALSHVVPRPAARDIDRLVGDGLLLFARAENQSWLLCRTRPPTGAIKAMVRADLRNKFVDGLKDRGAKPITLKAVYRGWFQVEGFHADELPLGVEWVRNIRCLDETISPPRITLADGVQVPSGWLGLRGCLPRVSADAEHLTIEPAPSMDHGTRPPEYRLVQDGESGWCAFPQDSGLALPLSGRYLLRAKQGATVLAVRPVEFRTHAYGVEYSPPSTSSRWLIESGRGDVVGLTSALPGTWEGCPCPHSRAITPTRDKPPIALTDFQATSEVTAAGEVMAAIGARRQGIDEPELIDWLCRIMGVSRSHAYDIARAWVEAGLLECLIYRHWKKRTYFPRKPRLVVRGMAVAGVVCASIMGLVPLVNRRELEDTARRRGIRFGYAPQVSPWVLPPLILEARDGATLESLSAACHLSPTELLPPVDACTVTIGCAAPSLTETPLGYQSEGVWDWGAGRFTRVVAGTGVQLERLARPDAPDVYVVRRESKPLWIGWSRTWGFLVAAHERRLKLVESVGAHTVRVSAPGVRLPLPLARWACAITGLCPGPVSTGPNQWAYLYGAPGPDPCSGLNRVLVGATPHTRWVGRANWLATLAAARSRTTRRFARVPESARQPFVNSTEPAIRRLGHATMVPRELLSHLLALSREIEQESQTW